MSSPVLKSVGAPINRKSLRSHIVESLQNAIILGQLKPGHWLVERELAASFGVSAIPVREALQELEVRGLVTRRQNRGCVVTRLSATEMRQILALREHLEPKVVEWATENLDGEAARILEEHVTRTVDAAENGDLSRFFYEDLCFHRVIWSTSGNRYAANALETTLAPLFAAGLMLSAHPRTPNLKAEADKHRRLLGLMIAGRSAEAAAQMLDIARGFEKHIKDSQ